MTTPSPARQAAEAASTAWVLAEEIRTTMQGYAFEDGFLAGAAWMNEQCATWLEQKGKEHAACVQYEDDECPTLTSLTDHSYADDLPKWANELRALMPEQDGTREGK
jgi:hypothetical protein